MYSGKNTVIATLIVTGPALLATHADFRGKNDYPAICCYTPHDHPIEQEPTESPQRQFQGASASTSASASMRPIALSDIRFVVDKR